LEAGGAELSRGSWREPQSQFWLQTHLLSSEPRQTAYKLAPQKPAINLVPVSLTSTLSAMSSSKRASAQIWHDYKATLRYPSINFSNMFWLPQNWNFWAVLEAIVCHHFKIWWYFLFPG
jgi:hypothetical protein